MQPENMTRKQLQAAAAKAHKRHLAACDALIAAGRGNERYTDTRAKDDELSRAHTVTADACAVLETERRRRMEWHGSEHRIIRRA